MALATASCGRDVLKNVWETNLTDRRVCIQFAEQLGRLLTLAYPEIDLLPDHSVMFCAISGSSSSCRSSSSSGGSSSCSSSCIRSSSRRRRRTGVVQGPPTCWPSWSESLTSFRRFGVFFV